ncbi:heterokaryon incompatibility protein-domain-containing protein [Xylaria sp. FL0933]|nr:heterokaryon incompatibility protein-domain-containing protein [Xylaria sp. FL0933]
MLSKDEIRILHLMPPVQNDDNSPIVCEISVAARSDNPDYEALSYAWDDRPPLPIQLSGSEVKVTPRLYNALQQLRLPDRPRNLWVDQLCIEQWNLEEKAQQVQLMRSTYTGCSRCLVWLGMPPAGITNADAQNAFDIVRYLAAALTAVDKDIMPLPSAVADDRSAFNRAMEALRATVHGHNPWWNRVWTVQEAALPDEVHILFGKETLPWDIIATANRTWTHKGIPRPLSRLLSSEQYHYIGSLMVHSIWVNVTKQRYDNALETINRWRFRLATDPRDKAFGLFGLFDAGSLPRTEECRYDIPIADVFSCMTVEIIVNERGLRPLAGNPRLEAYQATPGIPRWAVDLSAEPEFGLDWFYQCYGYDIYNADEGLEPLDLDVISACVSEKTLKLKGVRVGSVKCIREGHLHFRSGCNEDIPLEETLRKWLDTVEGRVGDSAAVVPDPYPTGYSRSEAFVRLMLGDLVRDNNQVPQDREVEEWFPEVWALMDSQTVDSDVHLTVHGMLANQTLIITETGLIGSALNDTELEDEVWIFRGGKVPFTLRPRGGEHSAEYDFVGKCYVQGIMQGEAFANNGSSQKPAEHTVVIY